MATRRRFTQEYKDQAVSLHLDSGRSIAEVGELTGALHAAAGTGGGGATPSEAAVDVAAAALTADVMRRVLQAAYDVDRVRRRSGGPAGGVEGA